MRRLPAAALWWLAEAVVAGGAFVLVLAAPSVRALIGGMAMAIGGGLRSTVALTAADPGTAVETLETLAKAALLLAAPVRMLAFAPRRRVWAPLLAVVFFAVLALSLPAVSTWAMWLVLLLSAGLGLAAARRPWLKGFAFLPWLVTAEPLLGHSPLAESVWPPARLVAHCAGNDGVRPADLDPSVAVTRYFGVTPVSPQLMLVSGERRSFWAQRGSDGGVTLGAPTGPRGNLWQGCISGDRVWMARNNNACWATADAGFGCEELHGPAELGVELDYTDVICRPGTDSIYVGQLVRGGLLELDTRTLQTRWHRVMAGFNLQVVPRADGRMVGITTSRLFVFDLATDTVLADQAAGSVAMGIDVCQADDGVAVSDFAGRLRLFERRGDAYVFRAGVSLPAPRRVAFSPRCDRILVTSGDDRRAFLLRRNDLTVLRTYRLGPGLRDVVFLDDDTAAAADGCTVNVLDVRE